MGETLFLIYSTRSQGFVYRNGTYGTEVPNARQFGEAEAFEYCKRGAPKDGASPLFPIPVYAYIAVNGPIAAVVQENRE